MTFYYFAYGSNMLPARLVDRCPSAMPIGKGVARNFRLEFSKASKDGSGKATLVPAFGESVPGVIFEIATSERESLDKHEGGGYRRNDAFVVETAASGSTLTSTYFATSTDARLRPFDWYLATVIAGAIHQGLCEAYSATLRSIKFIEDTDADRATRVAAIRAMRAHGVDEYRTLLKYSR